MYKNILTISLIFIGNLMLLAQPLDREVVVTKDYVPIIQDANRISLQPQVSDSVQIKPSFSYRIYPIPAKTSFEVKPIKAAKLVGIPVSELYNYYIRGGIGNHHLPQLSIHANNLRSDEYLVGAMLDINNIEGKIKLENDQKVNASNSSVKLMGYGKRFLGDINIEGNAGVEFNKSHLYGLNPDTVYDPIPKGKDIRQNYSTLFVNGKMYSIKLDQQYSVEMGLSEAYTWDHLKYYENDFGLQLSSKGRLEIFDVHIDAGLNLLNNNFLGDSSLSSSIFMISPYIEKQEGDLRYKLGLSFVFETIDSETEGYIYPKAELEYSIAGSILTTFFRLDGQLMVNSYRNVLSVNPFIKSGLPVNSSNNKLKATAGVKGDITKSLSYYITGELQNIEDYALFVKDTVDVYDNYYTVLYGDVDIMRIGGGIDYTLKNKFNFSLSGNSYVYDGGVHEYAWHLPEWDLNMVISYNLQDKVTFSGDLNVIGKRYGLDNFEDAVELKSFAVFDLQVDYHFSKVLSAFLTLKNLNASSYQLWYQYPYFKTMVVVGGAYKF